NGSPVASAVHWVCRIRPHAGYNCAAGALDRLPVNPMLYSELSTPGDHPMRRLGRNQAFPGKTPTNDLSTSRGKPLTHKCCGVTNRNRERSRWCREWSENQEDTAR